MPKGQSRGCLANECSQHRSHFEHLCKVIPESQLGNRSEGSRWEKRQKEAGNIIKSQGWTVDEAGTEEERRKRVRRRDLSCAQVDGVQRVSAPVLPFCVVGTEVQREAWLR